jgi:hypothetical protein
MCISAQANTRATVTIDDTPQLMHESTRHEHTSQPPVAQVETTVLRQLTTTLSECVEDTTRPVECIQLTDQSPDATVVTDTVEQSTKVDGELSLIETNTIASESGHDDNSTIVVGEVQNSIEKCVNNQPVGDSDVDDQAVGKHQLDDQAVGKHQLDDQAVGKHQLDDQAVGEHQLDDQAVGEHQLDDQAVGEHQLDDQAVGEHHLDDQAVGEHQLDDQSTAADVPQEMPTLDDTTVQANGIVTGNNKINEQPRKGAQPLSIYAQAAAAAQRRRAEDANAVDLKPFVIADGCCAIACDQVTVLRAWKLLTTFMLKQMTTGYREAMLRGRRVRRTSVEMDEDAL